MCKVVYKCMDICCFWFLESVVIFPNIVLASVIIIGGLLVFEYAINIANLSTFSRTSSFVGFFQYEPPISFHSIGMRTLAADLYLSFHKYSTNLPKNCLFIITVC